jgi:OmcA/MtrC family decaheme c-type cytochrome
MRRRDQDAKLASAAALLAALALGCVGLDGPPGDQGAQGTPGAQGPQGPQGPEGEGGTQGLPGNDGIDGADGIDGEGGMDGKDVPLKAWLAPGEDLPGLNFNILALTGGSGQNGNFKSGDFITVRFSLTTKDGRKLPLADMDSGGLMVAGPTSGYQRVLPVGRDKTMYSDLKTRAVEQADGTYSYTFADPLPATYGPPLYDTTKFTDGERTGEALADGTYLIGGRALRTYYVDGKTPRDVGNGTLHFLVGDSAATVATRDVVANANCNTCHNQLQFHGGGYRDVKLCVMCHTAGAEDRNSTDTDDATPETIEFAVMIHKVHNGAHLPSVLGVGTKADGTRDYTVAPKPYKVGPYDFSKFSFPVWPVGLNPMPRDLGYSALTAAEKAKEDKIRTGAVDCAKCHGDPDGAGPKVAPADGDRAYDVPTRRACGSCHDDVDWTVSYVSNGMSHPAATDDSQCSMCHRAGNTTSVNPRKGHQHPMTNPDLNAGLVFTLTQVAEDGAHDNDGTFDPGEKVKITFSIKDRAGGNVAPSAIASNNFVISGPSHNRNLVAYGSLPMAKLGATADAYTVNLPQVMMLERVGASTASLDTFTTALTPHWNLTGAMTSVLVRTGTDASSTLSVAASPMQVYLDVTSATGFARGDYVAVGDGTGDEEYLRVQNVIGNRLWFNAPNAGTTYGPWLRGAHASGTTVTKVTVVAKAIPADFTLDPATGTLTEVTESGTGNIVLATYTTDFVVPAVYGPAINDSPDLGETSGEWSGKPLVSGTYAVGLWGYRNLFISPSMTLAADGTGDNTTYRNTSKSAIKDVLFGSATKVEPYSLISSPENCNACHGEVMFHGSGRVGADNCLLCHATAGAEDRPQYVATNAPASQGALITFREMLHKIHRGKGLANASTYELAGYGTGAFPNNFGVTTFENVTFPVFGGGTKACQSCHGATNTAWKQPANRNHPTAQGAPVREWAEACGSCHDSAASQAHIGLQTYAGVESCAVCHGQGRNGDVAAAHKMR